ncbi:MAG: hypothetical protein HRU23_19600, partial [Gammaproteobacteria bacterium]|nr:hypothetical protein [Gammaproteobacteria bacterium]
MKARMIELFIALFFIVMVGTVQTAKAATTSDQLINAPGDIVFTAYHAPFLAETAFSFLLLDDCPAGCSITFTDKEWNGSSFTAGEGVITWSSAAGTPKGTLIEITGINGGTLAANVATITYTSAGGFGVTSDDQLYAFTGSVGSPTAFLSFVGGGIADDLTSLSGTGLEDGKTAHITMKESYYNGSSTFNGTAEDAATAINGATWAGTGGFAFPDEIKKSYDGTLFITATAPTVTTTSASTVTTVSAVLGGNVTSDGGAAITERGIVYSTSNNTPTIGDGHTKNINGSGTGVFSATSSGLTAGTTYYYNAYAINSAGTNYGTATSFTTTNPTVTLALSSSSLAEDGGTATVTATLSAVSGQAVTVTLGATGTAIGGNTDYNLSSNTISIPAGSSTGTAIITGKNDLIDESSEAVVIDITNVSNGSESAVQQVTASIIDDDIAPVVTFGLSNSPLAENGGVATITAYLNGTTSDQVVAVSIEVSGTATGSGTDYNLSSSTILIPAFATWGTVVITGVDDTLDEENESIIIDISNVTNGTESGTQQVTALIADDDAAPMVAFFTPTSSGSEAQSAANLTVNLSAVSAQTVTVAYTVSGTATGSGTDYRLANGTLTFAAGQTSKTITIGSIVDDVLDEANETVVVTLSAPTNATLGTNSAHSYTITDNDAPPMVAFFTPTSNGLESLSAANLTVNLSAVSAQTVTVAYTVSGTATGSGTDYSLASGTLTFAAGQSSKTIIGSIIDDTLDETNETVVVTLSAPTNASLGNNAVHSYTITDNDAPPMVAFFTPTSSGLESQSAANLTVNLSAVSAQTVTVAYSVSGTATGSGTDYNLASGTVIFTPGETSQDITIDSIVDDTLDETNETIIVTLSVPTNASLGNNAVHSYTITDNDAPPMVA